MNKQMDEIEKLRELFKSAKNDYEALKKRAEAQAVSRRWASDEYINLEPFYFEFNRFSKGRVLKEAPKNIANAYEYGFDAQDRAVFKRQYVSEKYFYEEFYFWRQDEILSYRFDYYDKKCVNVKRFVYEDGALKSIYSAFASEGYWIENFTYEGGKLAQKQRRGTDPYGGKFDRVINYEFDTIGELSLIVEGDYVHYRKPDKKMSYKLVLIDLDDTLFDYPKTEKEAFRRTFEELGFFMESELGNDKKEEIYEKIKDRYKDVNLQLWKDLEKGAVDKDRLKVVRFEKIIEEFDLKYNLYEMSELYLKKLGEGIFPFEAAEKLCEYLHSKYKVGIVTNGIKEVQHSRIENSTIAKYIDKIIISDEVGVNKPDKRIFEYAMNYFEIMDKSEVIMIGDSLGADIKGGQNAGIDTCWINLRNNVNDTGIVPKYEVRKLEELFEIL